ncbi:MAG TPA: SDR family NAD(P)-dependent oxidoreductase [Frankiaceae bacterium]|jgi:NAD(P)-dependent dehydrogenase (short-subunit alcohol dehydrogenase family)|nr:SDR family NAD(P)-dependent oxidoreductase [Frankiaceae bacterium]
MTTDQAAAGRLRDKVCVVTGAGSGIGRAMAMRFAAAGMKLVLVDIERGALDAVAAELGGDADRVLDVRADVASMEEMNGLRDAALERFGRVDVVCLNAGVAPVGGLLETTLEVWEWVIDVNLRGVFYGAKAFGPVLAEQGSGHIVCTASVAGLMDATTLNAYGTSKHAVVGLASALRGELAAFGVGVSVLCPGLINTKIFESERNRPGGMDDPSQDNPMSKQLRDLISTQGVSPDQVAGVVHQAVLDNQFFVFPTSDLDEMVQSRITALQQGLAWRDSLDVPH